MSIPVESLLLRKVLRRWKVVVSMMQCPWILLGVGRFDGISLSTVEMKIKVYRLTIMFIRLGVPRMKKVYVYLKLIRMFRVCMSGRGLIIYANRLRILGQHGAPILVLWIWLVSRKMFIICIRVYGRTRLYCIYCLIGTGSRGMLLMWWYIITKPMKLNFW